ncbi:MAG: 16S rRNA (cytosine(1402)-N(4))-methyltransferase [Candidatus Staskawiczbacteria bacterium RIFOXYC1_FULL_37_43]|nr:MAG: 16S rRNA (cytosine(1402)-N(4))-methyltransferase [Candidatus Staskawiczbacteria bacterium RIFCSPHIGHO2_01_FULL_37_17]OGZ71267.1 MAG: 16S rRNA (cytosine(1402)-N(4))-methyltransferase [Candidatus Staskawiczbacteria bacterium RIFCSPLOWO2_01_FULL_37_19]OGZ75593.1 MAG: 16S rRNA (cytosine(1402)-N(4))-methyltransferase [Candidatus Staskawiczbacteria bacterium RIFOXYA1_FULL_37_15]OGZ77691.1 MAG: 16S rRNA (cytosine(1402)-N(4))-methyltransferase [Candidatus Staskawiczbacteria bacterium RIFOXYA12_F
MIHIAVLTKEVLEYLSPQKNENFIDCTIGEGGHSKLILEKTGPEGKILGIDADENQIKNCREILENYKERLVLANDSYANLQKIVEKENFEKISGILLDLGWSSNQLKESKRGFSFLKDEPLDMRYSLNQELTAEKIINGYPQKEIEKILQEYGEERYAKKIAENIAKERRAQNIKSALQLVKIIERSAPKNYQYAKIHCATRTFQALRIAVNKELENLEKVLPQAVSVLNGGGRIAVISFHSLEDRIVKNFLKEKENQKILKILTKKPAVGQSAEIKQNPRSRSAKLRAAIKL